MSSDQNDKEPETDQLKLIGKSQKNKHPRKKRKLQSFSEKDLETGEPESGENVFELETPGFNITNI